MDTIENLFDEEVLVQNIKGAAYFILLYEHFEDTVIRTVKEFYSNPCVLDNVLYSDIDDDYIKVLKEKVKRQEESRFIPYPVLLQQAQEGKERYEKEILHSKSSVYSDGKKLRGSLHWLQGQRVLSEIEIVRILAIRKRRNTIVHELLAILCDGLTEDDAQMIADILDFNVKINRWRFEVIEMPVQGIDLPEGASIEDVLGGDDTVLMGIFRILFLNEGEKFREVMEAVRKNETPI